jgi:hypothetical protein
MALEAVGPTLDGVRMEVLATVVAREVKAATGEAEGATAAELGVESVVD